MPVLVLDQGGHSTRALVFASNGAVMAQVAETVDTLFGESGHVEQDALQILASLDHVLRSAAAQLGKQTGDVTAAALIVQRSSLLAWDRHTGEPLSPVFSWQDTRHAGWLERELSGRRDDLRAVTGLFPNAHYGASKMRWLLDNSPAVAQACEAGQLCIGPLASFLHARLTGSTTPVIDGVIASRTLLTSLGELAWCPELLSLFGIPVAVLPVIRPTLDDYGNIPFGSASVPLCLLGGDQSFVSLAHTQWQQPDTVFINAGTGAFVQQLMSPEMVPERLLSSALVLSTDPASNRFVAEGTVNAAASALDWLWQRIGRAFSDSDWAAALAAARADPVAVPVFCNRIAASGSPDWLQAGESYFSVPADAGLQAVAVLESVLFAVQRNLDALAAVQPHRQLVLSGGLSRLRVFCQLLANLSQTVVWCSDDAEASARGAAMQLSADVAGEQCYEQFTPENDVALQARYAQWSALMDHHAGAG